MKIQQQISDFTELIQSSSTLPLLVFFYSPVCGPSRLTNLALEVVEEQMQQQLQIIKIDSEIYSDLANYYQVHPLPALLLFKNGQLIGRIEDEHMENLLPAEQLVQHLKMLLQK
ncbi:MAG TPA: thioredoxin family protein [Nostocaceae cyanobacterium]|nr:thioredoxin family protein [Nostocaceae cyanobacterium]